MTYNDNIRTFVDISCHLGLKDEGLQATNPKDETLIIEHDARPYKPKYHGSKKFFKKGQSQSLKFC